MDAGWIRLLHSYAGVRFRRVELSDVGHLICCYFIQVPVALRRLQLQSNLRLDTNLRGFSLSCIFP